MRFSKTFIRKFLIFFTLLLSSSVTFAGPGIGNMTMTYSAAQGIPSLSGMMLIVLSLLLFAIAFRTAKQKQSNKFFVALISSSALLAAFGGSGQIKKSIDVQAGIWVPTVNFDQSGSTQTLNPGTWQYKNNEMGLTANISKINVTDSNYTCIGNPGSTCTEGTTLAPDQFCVLNCINTVVIPD